MKLDKSFKGTVEYFKERPGATWKQLICVPAGTKNAESILEEKREEFRSAYPNVEFKTEVK